MYGDNLRLMGGFAEYALAPQSALTHEPEAMAFAEASTLPQAGAIALQGTADVRSGQRVLINGAGGGSGAFAIPLAKQAGAHVTCIDNAGKLDFMRSLGADEVGDYRRQDFTDFPPFDRILDLVATRSPLECRRALAPHGRYRCVGGAVRRLLPIVAAAPSGPSGPRSAEARDAMWACSSSKRDRPKSNRSRSVAWPARKVIVGVRRP